MEKLTEGNEKSVAEAEPTGADATAETQNTGASGAPSTLLDGDAGATNAEDPKTDATAPVPAPRSLLDDEATDGKDGDAPGADAARDAPKAPTAEEVEAWVKGVPALDLGDGVSWDDATLRAMAPSLMGLKKDDSDRVIAAYADHAKAVAKAQAEAADAFNNGLIQQCEARFGSDLKKVASLAKRGGAAIFGDRIWNEMKTIPSFANNPDIMERLAEFGRRIASDGGKVTPPGGGSAESGDVLHRMYGNVKV